MRRPGNITEAPLAGPLSPIVLAVGAAAATVVVTIGVIAGPGTIACVQRGDFPICMNETFFGGSAAAAGGDDAGQQVASVPGAQQAGSTSAPGADAAETVGSQETATSVSEAVMPAFGLVRVEPDGSAVIAGSATPSGEVRIFANDNQIGAETVMPSGDFAFVTDAPLPTGGVELRILDVETDRFSDTSVVVVVQDDRTSEPLVIASAPGEASEILQGLDSPTPEAVTAENTPDEPAAETTPEMMAVADAEMASTAADASESTAEPEISVPVEQGADVPQSSAAGVDADQTIAAIDDEVESPVASDDEAASATSNIEASEADFDEAAAVAVQPQAAPQASSDSIAEQPDSSPANALPNAEEEIAASAASTVASVDDDGDAEIVSDNAPASSDQAPVAPDQSAEGAVATSASAAATLESEADAASPVTPSDAVESAPLESAPLESANETVAASSGSSSAAAEPEESDVGSSLASAQPAVESSPQDPIAAPTIDAVEIDGDRNFFAGAGEDGLNVRLYVDNEVVGSTEVSEGRWLIEAIEVLDGGSQRIRIDMLAEDGSVVARAEVDFVLDLPVATEEEIVVAEQGGIEIEAPESVEAPGSGQGPEAQAPVESPAEAPVAQTPVASEVEESAVSSEAAQPTPSVQPETVVPTLVGVGDGERAATGLVIIRQGDNLWTIARRVYGEGIRYTQIFEANTDQIRNPDLIYPGQVFDLPGTDEVIGEVDEAAGQ